jgi:hypothetical protein
MSLPPDKGVPLHQGERTMTTFTTPVVVDAVTSTYTLNAADILDVTGDDAITWEGADTAISVTIGGTITANADNAFTIGDTTPSGTLAFHVLSTGSVNSEFDAHKLGGGASITITNDGLFNGGDGHAMQFAENGGSVTLDNNSLVTNTDASKDVIQNGSNTTINNHGRIISADDQFNTDGTPSKTGGDGIDFGDDGAGNTIHNFAGAIIAASHHAITGKHDATITNDVGAQIIGRNGAGINFDNSVEPADLVTVINAGVIMGESQTYDDSDGDAIDCDGSVSVTNTGFIGGMGAHGQHDGGDNHSEALAIGGGTVNNSGTIFSVQRGIQVDDSTEGPAPAALTVVNSGIIQASNDWEAIKIVGVQNDKLTNSGTIIGDIIMDGGNDTVILKAGSVIKGDIQLGDGNDTLTAVEGKLHIDAGTGNDTVKGGSAVDTIDGSGGTDKIYGRGGADKLTGGADNDTFFFALGDTGTTAKTEDTITDFSVKDKDMINVHAFDANPDKRGNQDFTFISDADFHHKAGELRFDHVKGDTYVYGDLDGDARADFAIHLDGSIALKAGSFDL